MPGGRLLATCWGALADNPAYYAISEGLREFCSEAAARLPPFALSDADRLAHVAQASGLSVFSGERREVALAVPSAADLVN